MIRKLLLFATLLTWISIAGCRLPVRQSPSWAHVRSEVEKVVHTGTPLDLAEAKMSKLGFSCKMVEKGRIAYNADSANESNISTRESCDYLHCISKVRDGLVDETRVVYLTANGKEVEEILFYRGFVGP